MYGVNKNSALVMTAALSSIVIFVEHTNSTAVMPVLIMLGIN